MRIRIARGRFDVPRTRLAWNWLLAAYYNAGTEHLAAVLYDALAEFLRSRLLAGLGAGGVVLDAGCGAGHAAAWIARDNPQATVLGLDFSSSMVRAAANTMARVRPTRGHILQGDIARLPLCDASIDAVVSLLSLKWWPDPLACLRELSRVAKRDGHVLLVEMNPEASREEREAWKGHIAQAVRPPLRRARLRTFERIALPESLSAARATDLARMAGFVDVDVATIPGLPFLRLIMRPGHP